MKCVLAIGIVYQNAVIDIKIYWVKLFLAPLNPSYGTARLLACRKASMRSTLARLKGFINSQCSCSKLRLWPLNRRDNHVPRTTQSMSWKGKSRHRSSRQIKAAKGVEAAVEIARSAGFVISSEEITNSSDHEELSKTELESLTGGGALAIWTYRDIISYFKGLLDSVPMVIGHSIVALK